MNLTISLAEMMNDDFPLNDTESEERRKFYGVTLLFSSMMTVEIYPQRLNFRIIGWSFASSTCSFI